MVFQHGALYPHRSVRGNLAFPLRIAGMEKPAIGARVSEMACGLGIEEMLERWPGRLSGGERQRVAMGRALIRGEPQVLLMDDYLGHEWHARLGMGFRPVDLDMVGRRRRRPMPPPHRRAFGRRGRNQAEGEASADSRRRGEHRSSHLLLRLDSPMIGNPGRRSGLTSTCRACTSSTATAGESVPRAGPARNTRMELRITCGGRPSFGRDAAWRPVKGRRHSDVVTVGRGLRSGDICRPRARPAAHTVRPAAGSARAVPGCVAGRVATPPGSRRRRGPARSAIEPRCVPAAARLPG
jgi:hypothetical protein